MAPRQSRSAASSAHRAGIRRKKSRSSIYSGLRRRARPGFPDGSRFKGVQVYYARSGSDADHRILELIEGQRDRRGLIVVTSDRGLTAKVRVSGVRVMKSGAFRKQLAGWIVGHKDREDEAGDRRLSEWMRYFGVSEEDDNGQR